MLHDNLVTGIATTVAMSEVLYYGEELDHSLINQNQVRNDGIWFWDNPYDKDRNMCIEIDDKMNILLQEKFIK